MLFRSTMDSCPSKSLVCIAHLLYDPDLMSEQAGTRRSQTTARAGNAESWHGEPPQMTSTGGSRAPSSFVMSPTWIISGKWCFVTRMGNGSISLAQTGVIPLRTAARGNPDGWRL